MHIVEIGEILSDICEQGNTKIIYLPKSLQAATVLEMHPLNRIFKEDSSLELGSRRPAIKCAERNVLASLIQDAGRRCTKTITNTNTNIIPN